MSLLDAWIAAWLGPLAFWLILSGLDDLFIDLVWLARALRRHGNRAPPALAEPGRTRRIAVFLPLWQEHRVIGRMLERNLAALDYPDYHVFAGCYPNDPLTVAAVQETAQRFPQLHVAMCPHDGPTSKADCLNWIYQHMLLWEEQHGLRFEVIVTHDAEDWMHPQELRWINAYAERYDMIQIPVLPLATPPWEFTHGVYCDEFAEYQSKDIPARLALRTFLPSNGVGTGYVRAAIERLAAENANRVFDPAALTEDYAIGWRLHRLGFRQFFAPLFIADAPAATREYFPRRLAQAVRQRTRWVLGIALQSWQEFGWQGGAAQIYFFWRDRKGLIGNPLSCLVNLIFLYGLCGWLRSRWSGEPWGLASAVQDTAMLRATLALQCWRMAVRLFCTARLYGAGFALWSPLRTLWANWINFLATANAVARYLAARWQGRPLLWLKTGHMYPCRAALQTGRMLLGELLVRCGTLTAEELERALSAKPAHLRLGEYLVQTGRLSEHEVYVALSRQQEIPLARLRPEDVPPRVARALPANLVRRWKVLPFRVAHGNLFVAGPEPPTRSLEEELRKFTRLELRFHLVTPSEFERVRTALIEPSASAEHF